MQPKIEKLYTVSKTIPGADCGSDHELLIAKFRFKLKKVGKTTGNPLQYSCLENPWTEEPGRVQSMGSLRVRHD